MYLRRTALSFCALTAALPAFAQDVELGTILVENEGGQEFFGEAVRLDTGGLMKSGDSIAETPRSVSVIGAQEIAERGGQTVEQVLSYTAGVTTSEYGMDARSDWYLVRGFRPRTFHDGLPSRYGYYNDTTPAPFLLDSVEVLRGPASGLYGNSEVGGVVNTRSKTAATPSENIAQLSFGSHDRKQVALDYSGDLNSDGTLRYRFVGVLRDSATQVDYSQDDTLALAPSITWQPSEDTSLTLLANYQKDDQSPLIQFAPLDGTLTPLADGRELSDELFIGEPGFDRFETEQRALTAQFEHRFNSVWSMDATARYQSSDADYRHAWWSYNNYENDPPRYNEDGTADRTFYIADKSLETFAVDAHATAEYRLAGWDMRTLMGVTYSDAQYDSDSVTSAPQRPIDPFDPVYTGAPDLTPTPDAGTEVQETGVYVQNRATWNDRLHLDAGVRWGRIESDTEATAGSARVLDEDEAWTTNVALLYAFDNGVSPYVSYAESFRQEVAGTDASGTPFDPTRGEQYEIGVKYQPPGTDMLFSAAAFDLTKSNLTQSDPANPGFQVQTGEATSRGLEFSAQTEWRDFGFDASATFLETENADGYTIATVAETTGSLWVNYSPSQGALRGWSFGAGARYTGEKWDGADSQKTPSYTLYDARVAYETDRYNVALNVRNLTDERHVTYCASGGCYFGQGRSVALTATTRF